MNNDFFPLICAGWLVSLNCIAFAAYGIDKRKACRKEHRISEKKLMTLALLGGSIGAWWGMYHFRHKTQHLKFTIGIPLILCAQAALAWWCCTAFTT